MYSFLVESNIRYIAFGNIALTSVLGETKFQNTIKQSIYGYRYYKWHTHRGPRPIQNKGVLQI